MLEKKDVHIRKMPEEFSRATYDGFVLRNGYWYGKDRTGRSIATSGIVSRNYNNCLKLWIKNGDTWEAQMIPLEDINVFYPELKYELLKK